MLYKLWDFSLLLALLLPFASVVNKTVTLIYSMCGSAGAAGGLILAKVWVQHFLTNHI